jgi:hypothetical protein
MPASRIMPSSDRRAERRARDQQSATTPTRAMGIASRITSGSSEALVLHGEHHEHEEDRQPRRRAASAVALLDRFGLAADDDAVAVGELEGRQAIADGVGDAPTWPLDVSTSPVRRTCRFWFSRRCSSDPAPARRRRRRAADRRAPRAAGGRAAARRGRDAGEAPAREEHAHVVLEVAFGVARGDGAVERGAHRGPTVATSSPRARARSRSSSMDSSGLARRPGLEVLQPGMPCSVRAMRAADLLEHGQVVALHRSRRPPHRCWRCAGRECAADARPRARRRIRARRCAAAAHAPTGRPSCRACAADTTDECRDERVRMLAVLAAEEEAAGRGEHALDVRHLRMAMPRPPA